MKVSLNKFLLLSTSLLISLQVQATDSDPSNREYPPQNDIIFTNRFGDLINGTRCSTIDNAPLSIQRKPQNSIAWRLANPLREKFITIAVAFHVITTSSGKGNVTQEQINQQISVLNNSYKDLKINFKVKSVDITKNDFYYTVQPGIQEYFMKWQLHDSTRNTLNFYIAEPGGGILGFATLPWMFDEASFLHGVVIRNDTLPGGSAENYNLGNTATHEVGHYLGLYHTFQGGCMPPGDYVDDTPYQAEANYGCPVGTDSCSSEGLDPIHNFMNYTYDSCMDHFTKDQIDRIDWAISKYKKSLL